MGKAIETVNFCGTLKTDTLNAWIIIDGINTIILPKSQTTMRRIGQSGSDFEFTIPYWLAKKEGII